MQPRGRRVGPVVVEVANDCWRLPDGSERTSRQRLCMALHLGRVAALSAERVGTSGEMRSTRVLGTLPPGSCWWGMPTFLIGLRPRALSSEAVTVALSRRYLQRLERTPS